ncbi:DUF456 domain-containing protein [Phaeocystidibacter marisrubri]|uniref:DUF456 domain-containing protein n=1 Tax=Phaeocystidibacter marisrubri TaxID=1577780 RepID=A0A6L3ZI98_9FLAO|nr:DUF456 domain-containing protein [Phaeocystidibacter marisrubri]KAB2817736.1 DUF456 domain-containing protein [Phaeocystidibacter marisrubri]GGH73843.1 membrane protein [Phaeocystidibacter marisrubri]
MDYLLYFLSFIFILAGIAGSILPVLPGPPLGWIGLLLFSFTAESSFSTSFLIWTAIAAAIITALDYVIPVWGTKKFGGTKAGVRGSTVGLLIGVFFAPFGLISVIIGPMIGAYVGEMMQDKDSSKALKSAIGSFIGFLLGSGMKLIYGCLALYWAIAEFF